MALGELAVGLVDFERVRPSRSPRDYVFRVAALTNNVMYKPGLLVNVLGKGDVEITTRVLASRLARGVNRIYSAAVDSTTAQAIDGTVLVVSNLHSGCEADLRVVLGLQERSTSEQSRPTYIGEKKMLCGCSLTVT